MTNNSERRCKMCQKNLNWLYVAFALCFLFELASLSPCPCDDPSLCLPASGSKKSEVFLFKLRNDKSWLKYDWTKVTSVVTVGFMDTELMCHAHKYGARAIRIVNYPINQLLNVTHRQQWIQEQVSQVYKYFYDGINFDTEGALPLTRKDLRDALTSLVNETYQILKAKNENYQVTYDVAWSPHCVDNRCYDVKALSEVTDFLFVMAYDERSQISGPCIAGPNSAYSLTRYGIDEYIKMTIPQRKLVLGVPWYGYRYPCINLTSENVCKIRKVPFRGAKCSDAAGKEFDIAVIVDKMLPKSQTGKIWDKSSMTPFFTYQEDDGTIYQVWYDDTESLQLKYKLAEQLNLRGVGMWNVDCVRYDDSRNSTKLRKMMWNILPKYDMSYLTPTL